MCLCLHVCDHLCLWERPTRANVEALWAQNTHAHTLRPKISITKSNYILYKCMHWRCELRVNYSTMIILNRYKVPQGNIGRFKCQFHPTCFWNNIPSSVKIGTWDSLSAYGTLVSGGLFSGFCIQSLKWTHLNNIVEEEQTSTMYVHASYLRNFVRTHGTWFMVLLKFT